MPATRIVIVGGGFAGVRCAKTLGTLRPSASCEVVLFNLENHMVFHPLLAEVAGASINPDAVAAPLRQMLPSVHCRTEEVQSIDLQQRLVMYEGYDGDTHELPYDHIVLACGSAVNLGTVPGMADHAFPLKTIGDAIALRLHIMQQLEQAEVCDDPVRKSWHLSFIVIGGGFSGVEVAGEINDLLRGTHRFYHTIGNEDLKVTLVHSRDHLLPEIPPRLREFARAKMEHAGIRVELNMRAAYVTPEGVGLQDSRLLRGATVVCTVGNTIPSVLERLDVPKERQLLLTEADMRIHGYPTAWAVGDCAHIINAYDNAPSPPTGQFAERHGQQVAENIARVMRGEPTRPFSFKPLGQLCAIGGHRAVAELFGVRLSGFLAWFLWRGVYLFKLPSWARRAKVGLDWAWDLVFPRDLAHPRTDLTERISTAHYQPGNFIFHQGAPALNFYIIVHGEVEVLRQDETPDPPVLLNILGPGDFFGEIALLDDRQHQRSASIRARTSVEVLVMGKNIFASISTALLPFRQMLADAIRKRSATFWQQIPAAREILAQHPVTVFVEPCSIEPLTPDNTFADAIRQFDDHASDVCCVVDTTGRLVGVITRSDIFRALDAGARHQTPVSEFMVRNPVTVMTGDTSLLAAAMMREHGFTWLPVVNNDTDCILQGHVRAEKMLHAIVQHLPAELSH